MDEPLSNLDAKLRESIRTELVSIHRMLGTTTVYVTHDQLEAMTMATKIVLMNNQVIQQIGRPEEFYNRPNNLFVSKFIGTPTINLFETVLLEDQLKFDDFDKFNLKVTEDQLEILKKKKQQNLQWELDLKIFKLLKMKMKHMVNLKSLMLNF
ncbi:Multiple sugar-binding transport ATP-binding protein MsmK [Spiroplasma clarkii]|uniref:hypothetical protein n=1 Tax=Spiroplasma clarkii TaxID=2139 RepID=UPI000B55520D|nr:hypothetical protein [Spiroplasma clarkii]ARU91367.1 Multiple sugar-binding transport ATP-binding protein MsmK [Spiroplasma clarkii]